MIYTRMYVTKFKNFKIFGPLFKKLPIRSLCYLYLLKCKNLDGVSTNNRLPCDIGHLNIKEHQ